MLVFALFTIILLVQAPVIVSIFPKENIIFTSTSIRKCLYCMKTHPIQFVLAQFCPKKAMNQSPITNIEYWGSYGPFLSRKSQMSKIQNISCNFFNFQYNHIPLRWLSTTSSTVNFDYSYARIYQSNVEDFDPPTTVIFTSSLTSFKK